MIGPLFVRLVLASGVPGNKALTLVTEDGEMVGKQISCVVESKVDCIGTVTVQFLIDGDEIKFANNWDLSK